jgi:hypothetical protein
MMQTRCPRDDERRHSEISGDALESGLKMNVVSRVRPLCINVDTALNLHQSKTLSVPGQRRAFHRRLQHVTARANLNSLGQKWVPSLIHPIKSKFRFTGEMVYLCLLYESPPPPRAPSPSYQTAIMADQVGYCSHCGATATMTRYGCGDIKYCSVECSEADQ